MTASIYKKEYNFFMCTWCTYNLHNCVFVTYQINVTFLQQQQKVSVFFVSKGPNAFRVLKKIEGGRAIKSIYLNFHCVQFFVEKMFCCEFAVLFVR